MDLRAELPEENLRKIKKALLSCKTVEQVATVKSWVGRLKLSKSLELNKELYLAIEQQGNTLSQYIDYQTRQNNV